MNIYILTCDSCVEKGRRISHYILGKKNAYAEFESALKEGENPNLYTADIAPTGLIMMGQLIK